MATYQIKRSPGSTAPTTTQLLEGELAYTQDVANDGANAKLYIESVDSLGNEVIDVIGGKYYTAIIDSASIANAPDTLVKRDSNGDFAARVITATLFNGVATSSRRLETPRTFSLNGDVISAAVFFDGTQNVVLTTQLNTGPSSQFSNYTQMEQAYLEATSYNQANTIVKRDENGDFSATWITADRFIGTATNALRLSNERKITLQGDVIGSAFFDGSQDIIIETIISQQDFEQYVPDYMEVRSDVLDATSSNVPDSIVKRDANGDFAVRNIIGDNFTGRSGSTSRLHRPIEIRLDGAVFGTITTDLSDSFVITTSINESAFGMFADYPLIRQTVLDATSINEPDTLVKRDANGNIEVEMITASLLLGTSANTNRLKFPIDINLVGDVIGTVSTDLGGDVTIETFLNQDVLGIQDYPIIHDAVVNATPFSVPDTIVKRDADGNFEADIITADRFIGIASSANRLENPKRITLTGDVYGTFLFDGSGDVEFATTFSYDPFESAEWYDVRNAVIGAESWVTGDAYAPGNPDTLVIRDADGDIGARRMFADWFVGRATTAERLFTPKKIILDGDIQGFALFDGSQDITINTSLAETISSLQDYENIRQQVLDATPFSVPDTIVKRDADGNFAADIITAQLFAGNAATASRLYNPQRIRLIGDVTGETMFDGSQNVEINTIFTGTNVQLGAHTIGNYVATAEGFNGIVVENSGTETANIRIGFDPQAVEFVEFIQDIVGGMVVGNSEVGMSVEYDDLNGKLHFALGSSTSSITLGSSSTLIDDNTDKGIEFRYVDGGINKFGFFGWDDSAQNWTFIPEAYKEFGQYYGQTGVLNVDSITGTSSGFNNQRTVTLSGDVLGQAGWDGTTDLTILTQLQQTGVNPGVYGGPNRVGVFTVNDEGRLTHAYETGIIISYTQVQNFYQEVMRVVGESVSNNIENGIDVWYDSNTQKINFDVHDFLLRLLGDVSGAAVVQNLTDTSIIVELEPTGVNSGIYGSESTVPVLNIDSKGRILEAEERPILITSSQMVGFDRDVRDIVGTMVNNNTELGISVVYDDIQGVLNFDVNDFTITLVGDVTGSAVVTNLGDVVITTTASANSVVLGQDTVGNYVAEIISDDPGLIVTGSGTEGAIVHLQLDTNNATYIERTQDIVGGMLDPARQFGITVTYDDINGKLDFNVKDFQISLTGDVSGVVTVTDLEDFSILTTIQPNSVELGHDTFGNYVAEIFGQDGIIVDNSGTETALVSLRLDPTNPVFVEGTADAVGQMVTDNIENGIDVWYDDTTGKLNFDVNDFIITLDGDLEGTVNIVDLQSATLFATIKDNSVLLGDDTVGQYAKTITVTGAGISMSPPSPNLEDGTDYTINVNSTPDNVPLTIVSRDSNGSFRSQDIILDGNLAVNGGFITTTDTIFELIPQNAEIVKFAYDAYNITIGKLGEGFTEIQHDLIVDGNLFVKGTTTQVNSTVTTVDDPVMTLGGDTPPTFDDTKDRGIEFRYYENGQAKIGFFGFDNSEKEFVMFLDATNNGEIFTGTPAPFNLSGATFFDITGNVGPILRPQGDETLQIVGDVNQINTVTSVQPGGESRVTIGLVDIALAGLYGNQATTQQIEIDSTGRVLEITEVPIAITADQVSDFSARITDMFAHGNHVGITATYDQFNDQIILTSTGGGGGGAGNFSTVQADTVNATDGNFTTVTSETVDATTVNATTVNGQDGNFTNSVTSPTGNFTTVNATDGNYAGTVTANDVQSNTATINDLQTTNVTAADVTSDTGTFNTSVTSPQGTFTNIDSDTVNANDVNAQNGTFNNTVSSPTGNITTVNSNTVNANDVNTQNVNATDVNSTDGNFAGVLTANQLVADTGTFNTSVTSPEVNTNQTNYGAQASVFSLEFTKSSTVPNSFVGTMFLATEFRSADVLLQITQGTTYQITRGTLIHNGTNVFFTEYSNINTLTDVAIPSFDINTTTNELNLLSTQTLGNLATYKLVVTALTV